MTKFQERKLRKKIEKMRKKREVSVLKAKKNAAKKAVYSLSYEEPCISFVNNSFIEKYAKKEEISPVLGFYERILLKKISEMSSLELRLFVNETLEKGGFQFEHEFVPLNKAAHIRFEHLQKAFSI